MSRVVSPINIELNSGPGEDGLVHLALIGEDGAYDRQQNLDYHDFMGKGCGPTPSCVRDQARRPRRPAAGVDARR
jgi:hypothetical protein